MKLMKFTCKQKKDLKFNNRKARGLVMYEKECFYLQ